MSRWVSARMPPTTMVRIATTSITGRQTSSRSRARPTSSTRTSAPNAAILVAAAMKPVTGVGAP